MKRLILLAAAVGLANVLAPAPEVQAQDMEPVMYVTSYKIQQARIDSLTTLTQMFDAPWHDFVASRVDGYQRWYYRHDTGDSHNFVIATMYPDWDYVHGNEMNMEDHWEAFKETQHYKDMEGQYEEGEVDAMFRWAYEGAEHVDNIYRPIMAQE